MNTLSSPSHYQPRRGLFWFLVLVQFLIAGTMILTLKSAFDHVGTGLLAIAGILLGGWAIVTMDRKTLNASPQLRPEAKLVVQGPYRWVRHPMYTGLLMVCGAYAIRDGRWIGWALWGCLVIVLAIKMAYEEPMLRDRFAEYCEYEKRVKRLVPFLF